MQVTSKFNINVGIDLSILSYFFFIQTEFPFSFIHSLGKVERRRKINGKWRKGKGRRKWKRKLKGIGGNKSK